MQLLDEHEKWRHVFGVVVVALMLLFTGYSIPAVTAAEPPPASAGSFTTHIPSSSAPGDGIAVRVFYPAKSATHFPEGAPIVVYAPGGHAASGTMPAEGVHPEVAAYGYIYVYFILPGGAATDGTASGGVYDYRGPACKRALADVLRYATGRLADTGGQSLLDRVPFALTANAGVLGSSNGGNLAITTFAAHGDEFPDLAWFAGMESPIGDQAVVIELSSRNGQLNPYYTPGTCTVTSCPWPGLGTALSFDAAATFQMTDPATGTAHALSGVLFVDGNGNGLFDAGEFSFSPLGGPGIKGYTSSELAVDIESQTARLFPSGAPSWLATPTEVEAYWAERDGSLAIGAAHVALPDMLVMDIATVQDHAQIQPDHPHIRSFMQGWIDAGHAFSRLNPDAAYLAALTGKDTTSFPDNPANTNAPYPGIEATLLPETVDDLTLTQTYTNAGAILELSDRARLGNRSANLDAVLASVTPAGTSSTPHFVDGDGPGGINYDGTKAALEPQLTVYGNSLYAAWYETNGTANQIRMRRYDGTAWTWADGGGASGLNYNAAKAAASPQLTVFGTALYAAWYEPNGAGISQIRVKKYDGTTWTWADGGGANGLNFNPTKMARNPQLSVFGGALYATWEEIGANGANQIRVRKYDGSAWSWADGGGVTGISFNIATFAANPQLTEFDGFLYATWQERSGTDQVRVKKFNGSTWTWADGGLATGLNFNTANNGDRPQLTVYNNALYATWREGSAAVKYQIRVKKLDGSTWTWADGGAAAGLNYDATQDSHEPQLTVLGSTLYAIWCESQPSAPTARQVRVKQFDGSTWTWTDGGGATGLNYDTNRDGNHQQLTVFDNQLYATWWEAAAIGSQVRVLELPVVTTTPDLPSTSESAFGVYMSHTLPPQFMTAESFSEQAMYDWCSGHMAELGAHWTRYSLLAAWQLIEPTLGSGYNWNASGPNGAPDKTLAAVYASGNDIRAVVNIQALSLGAGTPTRSPFTNPTEYQAFVQALAERYDGDGVNDAPGGIKVDYFQLANEVQDWFERGLTADQYAEAAQMTLAALRTANPNAQLVTMGAFAGGSSGSTLEDRYKQAIQAMVGRGVIPAAIDIHWWFWRDAAFPWQSPVFTDARGYLDSLGLQNVQIWSMEDGAWVGCPAAPLPVLTEEDQALTLVKRYVWGRANGIDKLFWQGLIDMYNFSGQADSPFNSMGLLDDGEQNCADPARRNTERIAYWSYKMLAATTDNPVATPAGTVSGTHDGTSTFAYQYRRKSDSSLFYILWREGGAGSVTMSVPGASYHITNLIPDRFGSFQESDIAATAGSITVSTGTQPLLISPSSASADTTPPTVLITSPVNGATVSGTVSVVISATDNIGVSRVELFVDNVLQSTATASPYSFPLDTNQLAAGSHTLQAKAYDAAGNTGSSSVMSVTVANASSTGYLLVTQLGGAHVYKLDPATNQILSQQSFSANPGRPALDAARRLAYLPYGNQLLVMKPDTLEYVTLTVSGLGNDGTFAAISPDGRTLAVVNHGADGQRSADDRLDIVSVNPDVWPPSATLAFTTVVGQQPIRALIDHNGRYAAVTVRDAAKIVVIELASRQIVLQLTLPTGAEPEGMELHPIQNIAYATLHGTNKIEIIDLSASPPAEVGNVAILSGKGLPQPSGGHFTPDGSRFYVSAQVTNEILLFNVSSAYAPVQDTGVSLSSAQQPHDIAFLPDNRAYVANTYNGQAHGSFSIIQNYNGTPTISTVMNDVVLNPLYLAYVAGTSPCTPTSWYQDVDGDGYGNPAVSTSSCLQPTGYVANGADCNDGNAAIHPGVTEVCDGIDNDCDGLIDEGVLRSFYRDSDGDGYGDPDASAPGCTPPAGYVADNTDCNDANLLVNPGMTEIPGNGIDDDCDGFMPVKLFSNDSIYDSVQPAYNTAGTSDIIFLQATEISGALNLNRNVIMTLSGGYDDTFTTQIGWTILSAPTNPTCVISNGKMIMDRIILR